MEHGSKEMQPAVTLLKQVFTVIRFPETDAGIFFKRKNLIEVSLKNSKIPMSLYI